MKTLKCHMTFLSLKVTSLFNFLQMDLSKNTKSLSSDLTQKSKITFYLLITKNPPFRKKTRRKKMILMMSM